MTATRRPAAAIWLLLLAVTFGPLLCRTGGDQSWGAVQATAMAGPRATGAPAAPALRDAAPPEDTARPAEPRTDTAPPTGDRADAAPDRTHRLAARTDLVDVPRHCSGRHAPGPDESAPLPTPHRGEPLAPSVAVPATLAAAPPARPVPARSDTGPAGPADPATLLPVLRI
ncbi:hypothetical protein OG422_22120 [Streptomyces sp. NBC_01525]|uniref:hypothetical protein n=1 Tax=Streptomyces sp. NBC_01525 TaxID=2903893 RepID=UPI0038669F62